MRVTLDRISSINANVPFLVYKCTNLINGKIYIGVTSAGLLVRSNQHIKDSQKGVSGCKLFASAIRKYGADNFYWKVIDTASSFEEMMLKEISYIFKLKPEYNICSGGRGAPGAMTGKTHSAKTKKRLREIGLEAASIEKFNQYRHLGPQLLRKKVVCLNTGEIFESTVAAAREKGVNQISLLYVCNRHPKRIATKGLVFRYFGDHLGGKEEADKVLLRKKARFRLVTCVTDGFQFESISKAAKFYNVSDNLITSSCEFGYFLTKKRLKFKYTNLEEVTRFMDTEAGKRGRKERAAIACLAAKNATIARRLAKNG